MLKSYGWGGLGWVAHEILVSAQGPLVLVLGLRVWGRGLTKVMVDSKGRGTQNGATSLVS